MLLPCVPVGWMRTVHPLVLALALAITLVESQPGFMVLWLCTHMLGMVFIYFLASNA